MTALVIVVLLLLLLGILGAVIKGLLWLTLIAGVLLLASVAYGWLRLRGSGSGRS